MNPLFIVAVGAGAYLIYEGIKGGNAQMEAKATATQAKRLPLTSPKFSNMKENPFMQKEKIIVKAINPTQKGQMTNPNMAGRWMLTLPDDCLVPMVTSFNVLKKKVIILLPNGEQHQKVPPKGLRHIDKDRYALEGVEAFDMFKQ